MTGFAVVPLVLPDHIVIPSVHTSNVGIPSPPFITHRRPYLQLHHTIRQSHISPPHYQHQHRPHQRTCGVGIIEREDLTSPPIMVHQGRAPARSSGTCTSDEGARGSLATSFSRSESNPVAFTVVESDLNQTRSRISVLQGQGGIGSAKLRPDGIGPICLAGSEIGSGPGFESVRQRHEVDSDL